MAGNSAEWIRIPDGNGGLKKVWIRDSTARRDIASLNTDVAGKQDALSTAQLNAVNSGITAAKVATYDAITVPTKTSELTNDSGYITSSDIPTIPTASTASPQMDGTASAGTSSSWSRGDHVHPSDTTKQDVLSASQLNAVNSGITAAKVTAYDAISVPTAYTSSPEMDGTASAGSSTNWSRGDHVHPSDTSKQDALSTAQLAAVNSGITAAKVSTYDSISVPTAVSELTNDSGYQTSADVSSAISAEAGLLVPYGYCSTATATAAKVVTVSPTVTSLTAGLIIAVKFQYANTVASPTLNVNSLGAKSIKRYGTTAPSTSAASSWNANSVVLLTYDGTYWMLADWNNTTYSGMSDAEYQAGTSTSNRLITPARLKAAIELHAPVTSVNGSTGAVTVTVPTNTSDLSNDSGFITSSDIPTNVSAFNNDAGYLTSAPVTSVNSKTGAVTLDASDVGALPDSTAIPSKTSELNNDSGFITSASVPSASSATPAMDGTAAVGSSNDYARADHVHPSDTNKQDALTSTQLAAVNSGITSEFVTGKFAVVTGTGPSAAGFSAVESYPTGFTVNNCVIIGLQFNSGTEWRYPGDGVLTTTSRLFARLRPAGIDIYTTGYFSQTWKVTLMRTDI